MRRHAGHELARNGLLRAAINYNNPLLARRDTSSGTLRGLAVDLSCELARRLNVGIHFVPCDAAERITRSASDDVWDVGFLAIDERRADNVHFTAPYIELKGAYLVPPGSPLEGVEDVDRPGVRIAVAADSAYDLHLARALLHARRVRTSNTPLALRAMAEGEADVVAAIRTVAASATLTLPGSRVLDGHFMTIPQAMAVPTGRASGLHFLCAFVEEMKSSGVIASSLQHHGFGERDAVVASAARLPD